MCLKNASNYMVSIVAFSKIAVGENSASGMDFLVTGYNQYAINKSVWLIVHGLLAGLKSEWSTYIYI